MHTQLCTDIVLVFDIGVAVGRLAMTVVYRYFHRFFPHFFPRCDLFSYKECSDQKNYLAKVVRSAQKPRVRPLYRPRRPFWGPLVAILDL